MSNDNLSITSELVWHQFGASCCYRHTFIRRPQGKLSISTVAAELELGYIYDHDCSRQARYDREMFIVAQVGLVGQMLGINCPRHEGENF